MREKRFFILSPDNSLRQGRQLNSFTAILTISVQRQNECNETFTTQIAIPWKTHALVSRINSWILRNMNLRLVLNISLGLRYVWTLTTPTTSLCRCPLAKHAKFMYNEGVLLLFNRQSSQTCRPERQNFVITQNSYIINKITTDKAIH